MIKWSWAGAKKWKFQFTQQNNNRKPKKKKPNAQHNICYSETYKSDTLKTYAHHLSVFSVQFGSIKFILWHVEEYLTTKEIMVFVFVFFGMFSFHFVKFLVKRPFFAVVHSNAQDYCYYTEKTKKKKKKH